MKEIRDDSFHMTFDDGLLIVRWLKSKYNFEEVDRGIKYRQQLTEGEPCYMLSDFRNVKIGSRDAIQRLSDKDAGEGVVAVAIVMNSKVQQILFNFFASIYKAPAPARIFSDMESARKWLLGFKQK